jgi:LacI family transcriptional regulator
MKIRIKDIADRAHVSTATVSLVLNNRPGVGDDMRQKILSIAKEMNYKGKITTSKKSVSFIKITNNTNGSESGYAAYLDDLIEGLSTEARSNGYTINMSYYQGLPKKFEEQFPDSEGFFFIGNDLTQKDYSEIAKVTKPVVLVNSNVPSIACDQIGIDNTAALYTAITHLQSKGHTHIGFIQNVFLTNSLVEREQAFIRASKDLGFSYRQQDIFSINPLDSLSMQGFENPASYEGPSAFVCGNDVLALKVYQHLVTKGFRISDDICLIGFEHLPESRFIHPPLTTIQFPYQAMGKIGFTILKERIEKNGSKPYVKYLMRGSLVDHQSAKKPI